MDSTPRPVQFFVNRMAGKCYVNEIPESVRIGFSADVLGTSLQITSIIHSTQATPLADKMKEIKWMDTEFSTCQGNIVNSQPIRREAEGSMPALLSRNPEHFQIEGNVITRTDVGFNGLDSPFSTVMLDDTTHWTILSVAITILAHPHTEQSSWMALSVKANAFPKLKKDSEFKNYVSCSLSHLLSLFFVNGKAELNDISDVDRKLMIGFSLAVPGTTIQINTVTNLAENAKTNESEDMNKTSKRNEAVQMVQIMEKHDLHATTGKDKQPSEDDQNQPVGEILTQELFLSNHKQPSNLPNPEPNQRDDVEMIYGKKKKENERWKKRVERLREAGHEDPMENWLMKRDCEKFTRIVEYINYMSEADLLFVGIVQKSGNDVCCFQFTWVSTTINIELSAGVHVDKKGLVLGAARISKFETDNNDSLIVATEVWSPLQINRSDDMETVLFDTISIEDG
ncbi:hypothetical protein BLNAU_16319 [Blattamonas nauphoetae]|uniref:Uncharacterized protein n=1 Tax=Blattamonas nauphoetae TaxID=2049346 RepID=A0ABQ9XAR5_9EUKA|nr:hypothetical protein BLNAU_16319 [Blattamonas nauphoetae]